MGGSSGVVRYLVRGVEMEPYSPWQCRVVGLESMGTSCFAGNSSV